MIQTEINVNLADIALFSCHEKNYILNLSKNIIKKYHGFDIHNLDEFLLTFLSIHRKKLKINNFYLKS